MGVVLVHAVGPALPVHQHRPLGGDALKARRGGSLEPDVGLFEAVQADQAVLGQDSVQFGFGH